MIEVTHIVILAQVNPRALADRRIWRTLGLWPVAFPSAGSIAPRGAIVSGRNRLLF